MYIHSLLICIHMYICVWRPSLYNVCTHDPARWHLVLSQWLTFPPKMPVVLVEVVEVVEVVVVDHHLASGFTVWAEILLIR